MGRCNRLPGFLGLCSLPVVVLRLLAFVVSVRLGFLFWLWRGWGGLVYLRVLGYCGVGII